jgi:hypothetical protein
MFARAINDVGKMRQTDFRGKEAFERAFRFPYGKDLDCGTNIIFQMFQRYKRHLKNQERLFSYSFSLTAVMVVSKLKSVATAVGLTVNVSFMGITSFSFRICPE